MDQAKAELLILIVEDDDEDWADLEGMLIDSRKYGNHEVKWIHCRSLRQTRQNLAKMQFDVILLDLKLIDSANPLETTRQVAELADPLGIPIVVVSGVNDDSSIARQCGLAGAYHHLQKGRFDTIDLLRAIELSYARATELRRQRDRFLESERNALENLELAARATNTLDQLRTDLRRFGRNEKHRKMFLTALIVVAMFVVVPSINEKRLAVDITDRGLTVCGFVMAAIWGNGSFRERITQGQEASDLLIQVQSRKTPKS